MKKWLNILPLFIVKYILSKDGFELKLNKKNIEL
jgi:hypothetical protein